MTTLALLPADDLALRLADDLTASFEDMVVAHQDGLFAFVLGMCGNAHDAEEVTQDAFVRAHQALATYDAQRIREMRLRPWLHRIALNLLRNRWRRRQVRQVAIGDGVDPLADPATGPEAIVERGDEMSQLREGLLRLPLRIREAVVARHVRGLSYEEAAEVLDMPVGTVKSSVHRGLALLREDLRGLREVV